MPKAYEATTSSPLSSPVTVGGKVLKYTKNAVSAATVAVSTHHDQVYVVFFSILDYFFGHGPFFNRRYNLQTSVPEMDCEPFQIFLPLAIRSSSKWLASCS